MSALLNDVFLVQRNALMGTAFRIVRDRQTAEDLAQDAYLRARKAFEAGRIEHIEAFLHQTARNLAIDYLRRRKTRGELDAVRPTETELSNIPADVPSLEAELIERERLRAFQGAMTQLPDRVQTVLRFSRIEGWSNAQIAEYLGVSERTVFNDLKLALAHCRDSLARLESR